MCRALLRHKVQLVAVERPDGLLVERLLDAGLRVLALHPNQVAATRARFRASGGKSDRFDAFVLCELARTDSHRFRVLEPDSDQTKALRALTRGREQLVQARVALCNQLRAELERFWPAPIGLFRELDSLISLAFLEHYPSPLDARALGEKRMAAFLARNRYSGNQTPAKLLAKLRSAAQGRAGAAETQAHKRLVLALVAALKPITTDIKALERQIARALDEHPDGAIFRSLFRDPKSVVTAATMLAEIGDCPRPLPNRRHPRRRRRPGTRRGRVRQTQGRLLPLGVQHAPARRVLHTRGLDPPMAPVGAGSLRQSDRRRARPPARNPHPWPRLVPDRLALLARPRPVRPRPPPRSPATCPGDGPHTVGPRARPSRHPADGRRRYHP